MPVPPNVKDLEQGRQQSIGYWEVEHVLCDASSFIENLFFDVVVSDHAEHDGVDELRDDCLDCEADLMESAAVVLLE